MSDSPDSPDSPDAGRTDWRAVLERQLDRERIARRESEVIAERSIRELRAVNASLDERVVERTVQLERALDAARSGDRAKQSFLAHLGNELATPLHGALGNLELVDRQPLTSGDRQRLAVVDDSLRTLSALLDGLMQLAAAEGQSLDVRMEALPPSRFIDEITERWQRRLAARGQLLIGEQRCADDAVRCDWRRLERVADALLDNVVQHAVAGPVLVAVDVVDAFVEFSVTDHGPGISHSMKPKVIAPFFRGDNAPGSAKPGAGIGLAVADRLLQIGGGGLTLADGGSGTAVTATLPLDRRSAERGSASTA